jgi:hypothetical protein
MPLALSHIPHLIERTEASIGDETYFVYQSHPAFRWLWHISLSVAAMSSAISVKLNARVNEGDYISLSCLAFDYVIRIPASLSIELALEERTPPYIPVTLHWGKRPHYQEGWAKPLQVWLKNIIWPGFIEFVEINGPRFINTDRKLADAIRNAYAHGGKFTWPEQRRPISFHGLSLDHSLNNKDIHDYFGYSDVIVLMMLLSDGILTLLPKQDYVSSPTQ